MKTQLTQDLGIAKEALEKGHVIGVPTETVYGLASNALNIAAVAKIFEIKGRPSSNPLILHCLDRENAAPFIMEFHDELALLSSKFCPGPLTLLVPKSERVPEIITAGSDRVAIRFPAHPMLRALLETLPFPLAAPSANQYGGVSPTLAPQVLEQLMGKIPWILDGGPCEYGLESTIVGVENNKIVVYRLGSITLDELSVVLGYIPELKNNAASNPQAPGMVKYHYAPHTPLHYFQQNEALKLDSGYIFLHKIPEDFPPQQCMVLSISGMPQEVARNLYRVLIEMDSKGFKALYIEKPAPEGLGLTLIDRLNRATAKFS